MVILWPNFVCYESCNKSSFCCYLYFSNIIIDYHYVAIIITSNIIIIDIIIAMMDIINSYFNVN